MEGVGRALQILGLAVVAFGFFQGIGGAVSAKGELGYLAAGALVFVAGRLLEGRGSGRP